MSDALVESEHRIIWFTRAVSWPAGQMVVVHYSMTLREAVRRFAEETPFDLNEVRIGGDGMRFMDLRCRS